MTGYLKESKSNNRKINDLIKITKNFDHILPKTPVINAFDQLANLMDENVLKKLPLPKINIVRAFIREEYDSVKGKMKMSIYSEPETWFHEFGHHIESKLEIKKISSKWRDDRSIKAHGKIVIKDLKDLYPGIDYKNERAVVNRFFKPYVGKIYSDGETEIISTGLENFVNSKTIQEFYEKDRSHFSLIVGVISGILK